MSNLKPILTRVAVAILIAVTASLPMAASAQSAAQLRKRQQTKNTWRNLGLAGGALGVYGLLKGDRTLAALGLGGGLYSAYRYEQDRKSQSRMQRARAQLFSRSSFTNKGHRYQRRTVWSHGKKYYKFVHVK